MEDQKTADRLTPAYSREIESSQIAIKTSHCGMVRQSLPCRFTCLPREIRWSHRSLRMIFQWAKDIDGSIQSAISLLATYVNTLHTRTVASIFAFPAILVLFICSTSASFPASIFGCGSCSYTPTKPHSPRADLFRMNVCFIACEIPWTRTEGLC